MATDEATADAPGDRNYRRRPFSVWMKRLANLKTSSSETRAGGNGSAKRTHGAPASKSKRSMPGKAKSGSMNTGLKPSGAPHSDGPQSLLAPVSVRSQSPTSMERPRQSMEASIQDPVLVDGRSTAATASTEPGTTHSDATRSHAESSGAITNLTTGEAPSSKAGAGSTFSSPAPSVRSLTTTLTTIQSTATTNLLSGGGQGQGSANGLVITTSQPGASSPSGQQGVQFSHQFPSSPPASAVPSHLTPQAANGNPTTYTAATANNLLTDNASILTLASSSKRHRRHSLDTDASVRALAPSSLWGGSRESLPLSILSSNVGDLNYPPTPGIHGRPSVGGITNPERASVYSASGIGPALSSERNSFYAGKPSQTAEAGSIKSGLPGHGRTDSISGSIGGVSIPLASPRETSFGGSVMSPGRGSRRSSGWVEVSEEVDEVERPGSRKPSLHGITRGLDG